VASGHEAIRVKWIKRLLALVLFLVLLIPARVVLADTGAGITVFANPLVTGGITDFAITYVSETQLDFSWEYVGDATHIMIRGKYGDYPENIPNGETEPSDGYQVYYGNASTASDTSINFDENPGTIYYTAWAQRDNGTWFTDIHTNFMENTTMALIASIVFIVGLSVLALWQRHIILYIIAFIGILLFGLDIAQTSWAYGISLLGLAAYMLYRGIAWFWR
jgi:hypothetical protein